MLAFSIELLLLFTLSERIPPFLPPPALLEEAIMATKQAPLKITAVKNEARVSRSGRQNFLLRGFDTVDGG